MVNYDPEMLSSFLGDGSAPPPLPTPRPNAGATEGDKKTPKKDKRGKPPADPKANKRAKPSTHKDSDRVGAVGTLRVPPKKRERVEGRCRPPPPPPPAACV